MDTVLMYTRKEVEKIQDSDLVLMLKNVFKSGITGFTGSRETVSAVDKNSLTHTHLIYSALECQNFYVAKI